LLRYKSVNKEEGEEVEEDLIRQPTKQWNLLGRLTVNPPRHRNVLQEKSFTMTKV
jgi:hypothetical protein